MSIEIEVEGANINEAVANIAAEWGGDYEVVAEDAKEAIKADKSETRAAKAEAKAAKAEAEAVVEEKPETPPEPVVEDDEIEAKAKKIVKEEATKVEEKEDPKDKHDEDLKHRLRIIEEREIKLRQRETLAKEKITSHAKQLEAMLAKMEEQRTAFEQEQQAKRGAYTEDPLKLLEEHGISFEALAVANLKRQGLPVPQSLQEAVRAEEPSRHARAVKDEIASVIEAKINPLIEKITFKEQQERAAAETAQQQQALENIYRAANYVNKYSQQFPLLSSLHSDPQDLGELMLEVRRQVLAQKGTDIDMHQVASYLENEYAQKLQPAMQKLRGGNNEGQAPLVREEKKRTPTLTNETAADKLTVPAGLSPDEEYALIWKQLGVE
jgi:hypothetical protein